jgi:hypothetical protein
MEANETWDEANWKDAITCFTEKGLGYPGRRQVEAKSATSTRDIE